MKSKKAKLSSKEINEALEPIYLKKGITSCEARLEGCMGIFAMSFHHRHKRDWYIKQQHLLTDFNQTILVCAKCHSEIERNYKKYNEKLFNKLRKMPQEEGSRD